MLAILSMAGVVALLAWDIDPRWFPPHSHVLLGAFPLATIGVAWLLQQANQRRSTRGWIRAVLLAAAFFFWAANQVLRNARAATVCNDIAITLFVFDLVWIIAAYRVLFIFDRN